jgi:hypothetical protein
MGLAERRKWDRRTEEYRTGGSQNMDRRMAEYGTSGLQNMGQEDERIKS